MVWEMSTPQIVHSWKSVFQGAGNCWRKHTPRQGLVHPKECRSYCLEFASVLGSHPAFFEHCKGVSLYPWTQASATFRLWRWQILKFGYSLAWGRFPHSAPKGQSLVFRKREGEFTFPDGKKMSFAKPNGELIFTGEQMTELRQMGTHTPGNPIQTAPHLLTNERYIHYFSTAKAHLYALRLEEKESVVAVGPTKLLDFPKNRNTWDTTATLTSSLLIFGIPKLKTNFLVVPLAGIEQVNSLGPLSASFIGGGAMLIDGNGINQLEHFYFVTDVLPSKNPSDNTLSLSLADSLGATLREVMN